MNELPLPDLTPAQNEILRICFEQLLGTAAPVPVSAIRAAGPAPECDIEAELITVAAAGRARLNERGDVTGAFGLSLDPTPHTMSIGDHVWHTWCAIDALGILGALEARGAISSLSPHSGKPIEIEVEAGHPCGGDLSSVVFLPGYRQGSSVVDQWCPSVNFFETADAAREWAAARGLAGECLALEHATELAAAAWRRRMRAPVIDR